MNNATQTFHVDPVAQLAKHVPARPGVVHTFGGNDPNFPEYQLAVVRHETENRWTVGLCSKWTYGKIQKALFSVVGNKLDVAAVLADVSPETAESHVSSEESRLRYVAEGVARDIEAAKYTRNYTNDLTGALSKAMAKAGCKCIFLAESKTIPDAWGDRDGIAVYCDSQEGADRIAEWISKWEQKRYEIKGGKYGCDYLQPQHAYGVRPIAAPAGVPFAAFAEFRYYSRGD